MSEKPTIKDLLAMPDEEFLATIAPFVQPKPYGHIEAQGGVCVKCGTEIYDMTKGEGFGKPTAARWQECPIPDLITDPLPVIVERERCKLSELVEQSDDGMPVLDGFSRAKELVRDVVKVEGKSFLILEYWYDLQATPRQQFVCLLAAQGKVEI